MLLFLDQEHDTHADWVEAECEQRNVSYFRFCTERFPSEIQLSVKLNPGALSGYIHLPNDNIPLDSITGVWYRRPGAVTVDKELDPAYHRFARMESTETLNGLYRALWDRRWVNPFQNDIVAGHKINQLRLAAYIGFQTVPTIVTNSPEEALAFFHACNGNIVYKTLRQVVIAHHQDDIGFGVYTSRVTKEDLEQQLDTIHLVPCLFQQFIPKKYELRINIIGDRVWTTAIFSQENDDAKLDFRPHTYDCAHEPILLPPKLEQMCVKMVRRLGLRMSSIDMIVTSDDEYIFLELNPNGQWAWIEDLAGFPLCTALVDELLGVDTLADHPYVKDRSLIFEPNTAIREQDNESTTTRGGGLE